MNDAHNSRSRAIGLFGGAFNPAHAGHLHVAKCGLQRLGLDQVWWMVSPGNPLKTDQAPYAERVASVKTLNLPPRMHISHMERDFGTRYTVDTLRRAKRRWPNTAFVFLMGADSLPQLPLWKGWREIMETVPIAVIARPQTRPGSKPSDSLKARLSQAARMYDYARISESQAHTLVWRKAPAWVYLTPPLNALSSTQLREQLHSKARSQKQ